MRRTLVVLLLLFGFVAATSVVSLSDDWTVDWYYLETPNFQVIFHEGLEEEAQEIGNILENAREFWDERFGVDYIGKFKFVVSNVETHYAGYTLYSVMQQYVAGSYESGGRFTNQWLSARNPSSRDMALYHEYGHAVDVFSTHGPTDLLRKIFGSSFYTIFGKPLIMIEGITIFSEQQRTGYSRANDPREQMLMRQMVMEEEVFTFAQLFYPYQREEWPSKYMMTHNVGPWLVRYLTETYGDDVIRKIQDVSASHPMQIFNHAARIFGLPSFMGPDFNQILEKSLKTSSEELYEGFNSWLQNVFREQLGSVFANPVTIGEEISPLPIYNYLPEYSPDGEWIAYFHNDFGRGEQIRLMRPDGSEDHVVIETDPASFFRGPVTDGPKVTWAADSKSFVLAFTDQYQPERKRNIYQYDIDSNRLTKLSNGLEAFSPQYTPDGKYIIHAQYGEVAENTDIYRFNLETGEDELIYEMPEHLWIDLTSLSPDGTQLAVSAWQWGGFQDIYIVPFDGSEPIAVTQNRASDLDPFWTSDGEYILFSSDITEVVNLYAYRVADGKFFQVTNVESGAFDPVVAPDSSEITFVGYTTKGYQLEKIPFDPASWTEVSMPSEDVPVKPEYPHRWEVKPFVFREMWPKGWLPQLQIGRVGVVVDGVDALNQQSWMINAGYNYVEKTTDVNLQYITSRLLRGLPMTFNLGFTPFGVTQSVNTQHTLISTPTYSYSLSLAASRRAFEENETYTISPSVSSFHITARDLLKYKLNLSVSGSVIYDVASESRTHQVMINARNSIRPPVDITQAIRLNIAAGWSDSERPMFGIGGNSGFFALPGFDRGFTRGTSAVKATLEYELPLWEYNETLFGNWPFFIQGLRGRFFADGGSVGPEFSEFHFDVGAELGLEFSFPYLVQAQIKFGAAYGIGEEKPKLLIGFGFLPLSIF